MSGCNHIGTLPVVCDVKTLKIHLLNDSMETILCSAPSPKKESNYQKEGMAANHGTSICKMPRTFRSVDFKYDNEVPRAIRFNEHLEEATCVKTLVLLSITAFKAWNKSSHCNSYLLLLNICIVLQGYQTGIAVGPPCQGRGGVINQPTRLFPSHPK